LSFSVSFSRNSSHSDVDTSRKTSPIKYLMILPSSAKISSFRSTSATMLAPEEDVDKDVTWEDQQRINSFRKLNTQLHEFRDEVASKQEEIRNLEDAGNELILAEEGSIIRYLIGEVFLEVSTSECEEFLEKETEKLKEEIESLVSQQETILSQMEKLKVILYEKFGRAINLEED